MERIKELRKEKKITMKQLGDIIGVAESTISLYENGKRQPDNDILLKLAEYFNVSVDYLLGYNIESKEIQTARKNAKKLYEEHPGMPFDYIEKKTHTNYATFHSWINGYGDFFNNKLYILADLFNVSVDYLLGLTTSPSFVEKEMQGIDFALWGEVKDLTDEEKQDIIKFAKFTKSKRLEE